MTIQYRFTVRSDSQVKSFITLQAANLHAEWRIWFGASHVSIEKL